MNNASTIKIELTSEQMALMRAVTRRRATRASLDLQIEELEPRIAASGRPATEGVCPTCGTY